MQSKEQLITKLFHDQCTREEIEALLEMIQHDPSSATPEVLEKLFDQQKNIPSYEDSDFDGIRNKIVESTASSTNNGNARLVSLIPWKKISRIVAVIMLMVALGWGGFQFLSPKDFTATTTYGEIKLLELPDGSQLSLNGNSSLTYPQNWESGETRKVYLTGEAYFEVEKKPATGAKFQVIANGITVEVLGTSFNVNARKQKTSVFLEEGKVKLTAKNEPEILLNPGEIIHYSVSEKSFSPPKTISGSVETSWKTGIIEFTEASMGEIVEKLAEANGIQYQFVEDSVSEEKMTISLPASDIEVAMSVLAKTSRTSISKKGEVYIIHALKDQK